MEAMRASSAAEPSVDDMKRQVETLRKDMRILAGMAQDKAGYVARDLRDGAREKAEDLSEEARRMLGDVKERGERLYGEAEDIVRRHPIAATGAAFLIGWLIGGALRR